MLQPDRLGPGAEVGASSDPALAVVAGDVEPVRQLRAFTGWVGEEGRELTQTGRVKLADAFELVALLGTGDELEPIGGASSIVSSAELPGLTTVVEWAKASRLVRARGGRLVAVKTSAGLLDRPLELWTRMFEVFPRLGTTLCPSGWGESFMRHHFEEAVGDVLEEMRRQGGTIGLGAACELGWEVVTARYLLHGAPEHHKATWRRMNDRDVRRALGVLENLGALRRDEDCATLTELGWLGVRRAIGEAAPGDAILQVKISLLGVSRPPVWRRLLVAANTRLDRLHEAIQAAMGWEDYHMHVFCDGQAEYGMPDPELGHENERQATLGGLVDGTNGQVRYTYDFGDDWEHDIVVEKVVSAEPGGRYPICLAGKGRCPPEDCGGAWGYRNLREVLADPAHEEHRNMLEWLGLELASEFDPAGFDLDEANNALAMASAGALPR